VDGERLRAYTEQDDGASISLSPGEVFEVRLAENPTTGYRWYLGEWDRSVLELARDEFRPPGTPRPGAGGEHVWEFAARAPGQCALRFAYRRGWESATPAKAFRLDVSVKTDG